MLKHDKKYRSLSIEIRKKKYLNGSGIRTDGILRTSTAKQSDLGKKIEINK